MTTKRDSGKGKEVLGMGVQTTVKDSAQWHDRWTFEKYASQEDYAAGNPYEVNKVEQGNLLLNSGINEMWDLIAGDSANYFDNTNARLGVGDDDTAAQATDTDLIGTNTAYLEMETNYPDAGSDEKIIFRGVADGDTANHDWNEFVAKQNTSGICLNRLVTDQGTKASGQVWTVTLEISLS